MYASIYQPRKMIKMGVNEGRGSVSCQLSSGYAIDRSSCVRQQPTRLVWLSAERQALLANQIAAFHLANQGNAISDTQLRVTHKAVFFCPPNPIFGHRAFGK